jgi:hypothetical protein
MNVATKDSMADGELEEIEDNFANLIPRRYCYRNEETICRYLADTVLILFSHS